METICNLANKLLKCKDWDPGILHSSVHKEIPAVGQNRSNALKRVADRRVGEACIVKRKVTSSLGEIGHRHLKQKVQ